MRRVIAFRTSILLVAALTLSVAAAPADANPFTWTGLGADNNWQTAGNWNNGTPDNNGTATLFFDGSTRLTPNTDVAYSVLSIQYNNTAGAFINGARRSRSLVAA